ncbi:hypothetical protein GCM10020331_102010 [Ectobacillus funiculus]
MYKSPQETIFVEFRYVHSIEDTSFTNRYGIYEGDLMVFIHSGSDISIKRTFMRYFCNDTRKTRFGKY